jgi:hypothetical protein
MIFRQKILIDWVALKQVRWLQAVANNAKENKKRLGHIYKVDDLILIVKKPYELAKVGKISSPTYSESPYRILKIYENGTVKIQHGSFTDILSIRRIMPYYSRNNWQLTLKSFEDSKAMGEYMLPIFLTFGNLISGFINLVSNL